MSAPQGFFFGWCHNSGLLHFTYSVEKKKQWKTTRKKKQLRGVTCAEECWCGCCYGSSFNLNWVAFSIIIITVNIKINLLIWHMGCGYYSLYLEKLYKCLCCTLCLLCGGGVSKIFWSVPSKPSRTFVWLLLNVCCGQFHLINSIHLAL